MYKDDPKLYIYTLGQRLLYDDTPLGRDIAGEINTVNSFGRSDFINYRDKFYNPENLVVAVAGKKEHDWLLEVEKILGNLPKKKIVTPEPFVNKQTEPNIRVHYRDTDQAHLMAAFKTFSRFDKRRYALIVLDNLLGGSMSSRLFITLRERHGLCYYIRSTLDFYQDIGDIAISAGVDINKIDKALELIVKEVNKLKNDKIVKDEIKKAKENICGRFLLSLEESYEIAKYFGSQDLFFDGIEEPEQFAQKIRAVSAEEIHELANEIFDFQKINFALIGPYKEQEKFLKHFV